MDTATVTEQIANADLLIRFVEVWHTDEASQRLVPMNAIAMDESSSHSISVQHAHSEEMLSIVRDTCEAKKVAIIRENDCSLAPFSQHVNCRIASVLCIPIVQKLDVRGAILIGFSNVHGAAEVWGRDDRDELAIMDGHYSGLPSFEYITRYTRFPKGAGIPGGVWKSGLARVARKLDQSSAFIRSFGCDPANVSAAVALPIADSLGFPKSVLVFLQAALQPLARSTVLLSGSMQATNDNQLPNFRIESIQPVDGSSDDVKFDTQTADSKQVERWERDIESVLSAKVPLLMNDDTPDGNHRLIWPVYSEQNLASVLIMTF